MASTTNTGSPQESPRTRLVRFILNRWPAIHSTGARVTFIATDWSEVRLKLPLKWRTYNAMGTIFGGSMVASCDPFYMLMLMARLGPDYIVWDKAAHVQFRRPGRSTLTARFIVSDDEVAAIKAALEGQPTVERTYTVDLVNADGEIIACIDKLIHIRPGDRLAASSGDLRTRFVNWVLRPG